MKVTDIDGVDIDIINLNEAIRQSYEFSDYYQIGSEYSLFNEQQKIYWTDLYNKLVALRDKNLLSQNLSSRNAKS